MIKVERNSKGGKPVVFDSRIMEHGWFSLYVVKLLVTK
jgi:hypothetical protein